MKTLILILFIFASSVALSQTMPQPSNPAQPNFLSNNPSGNNAPINPAPVNPAPNNPMPLGNDQAGMPGTFPPSPGMGANNFPTTTPKSMAPSTPVPNYEQYSP